MGSDNYVHRLVSRAEDEGWQKALARITELEHELANERTLREAQGMCKCGTPMEHIRGLEAQVKKVEAVLLRSLKEWPDPEPASAYFRSKRRKEREDGE